LFVVVYPAPVAPTATTSFTVYTTKECWLPAVKPDVRVLVTVTAPVAAFDIVQMVVAPLPVPFVPGSEWARSVHVPPSELVTVPVTDAAAFESTLTTATTRLPANTTEDALVRAAVVPEVWPTCWNDMHHPLGLLIRPT
jgi:hypothetical protein